MFRLTLHPMGGSQRDAVQYSVSLPNGEYAVINPSAHAWRLNIYTSDSAPIDRGLFATPYDALAVLEAEVTATTMERNEAAPRPARQERRVAADASHSREHRATQRHPRHA